MLFRDRYWHRQHRSQLLREFFHFVFQSSRRHDAVHKADRFGFIRRFFTTLLSLSLWDRLTIVLGDLAKRAGVQDSQGTILIPEILHERLAEAIGCSRPMVSRLIAQMIDRRSRGDLVTKNTSAGLHARC
jgi:hypothetical protein